MQACNLLTATTCWHPWLSAFVALSFLITSTVVAGQAAAVEQKIKPAKSTTKVTATTTATGFLNAKDEIAKTITVASTGTTEIPLPSVWLMSHKRVGSAMAFQAKQVVFRH